MANMGINYPSMNDLFGPGLNDPGDYPQYEEDNLDDDDDDD